MSGCGRGGVVGGGVVVGEDGAVLGEDIEEMNSTHFNSPADVLVGCRYSI